MQLYTLINKSRKTYLCFSNRYNRIQNINQYCYVMYPNQSQGNQGYQNAQGPFNDQYQQSWQNNQSFSAIPPPPPQSMPPINQNQNFNAFASGAPGNNMRWQGGYQQNNYDKQQNNWKNDKYNYDGYGDNGHNLYSNKGNSGFDNVGYGNSGSGGTYDDNRNEAGKGYGSFSNNASGEYESYGNDSGGVYDSYGNNSGGGYDNYSTDFGGEYGNSGNNFGDGYDNSGNHSGGRYGNSGNHSGGGYGKYGYDSGDGYDNYGNDSGSGYYNHDHNSRRGKQNFGNHPRGGPPNYGNNTRGRHRYYGNNARGGPQNYGNHSRGGYGNYNRGGYDRRFGNGGQWHNNDYEESNMEFYHEDDYRHFSDRRNSSGDYYNENRKRPYNDEESKEIEGGNAYKKLDKIKQERPQNDFEKTLEMKNRKANIGKQIQRMIRILIQSVSKSLNKVSIELSDELHKSSLEKKESLDFETVQTNELTDSTVETVTTSVSEEGKNAEEGSGEELIDRTKPTEGEPSPETHENKPEDGYSASVLKPDESVETTTESKDKVPAKEKVLQEQVLLGTIACGQCAMNLLFGKKFDCCLVLVYKHKPTQTLLRRTHELLEKTFELNGNLKSYQLVLDMCDETITVENHLIAGLKLVLRFTSPEHSEDYVEEEKDQEKAKPKDVQLLDAKKCKLALSMIRRLRWYHHQRQMPGNEMYLSLIRLFMGLKAQTKWRKLPLWVVMVLIPLARKSAEMQIKNNTDTDSHIDYEDTQIVFQRCLEILSNGVLLGEDRCIQDPTEKNGADIASCMEPQDRESITSTAMDALRHLAINDIEGVFYRRAEEEDMPESSEARRSPGPSAVPDVKASPPPAPVVEPETFDVSESECTVNFAEMN